MPDTKTPPARPKGAPPHKPGILDDVNLDTPAISSRDYLEVLIRDTQNQVGALEKTVVRVEVHLTQRIDENRKEAKEDIRDVLEVVKSVVVMVQELRREMHEGHKELKDSMEKMVAASEKRSNERMDRMTNSWLWSTGIIITAVIAAFGWFA